MHFIGYVIGEDIESALEPFSENREVEPYKVYEEFIEVCAMYRHYLYEKVKKVYDIDIPKDYPDYHLWSRDKSLEDTIELVGGILKEQKDNRSVEDFMGYNSLESFVEDNSKDWDGSKWEKDENGWYRWSTYNPNGQWDWYSIGGRWGGFFQLKEGAEPVKQTEFSWLCSDEQKIDTVTNHRADSAYRKDIVDFENQYPYYVVLDGKWLTKYDFENKNKYVDENGRTRYDFDKANEEWQEFLKNEVYPKIGDNDIVTVVDCHS